MQCYHEYEFRRKFKLTLHSTKMTVKTQQSDSCTTPEAYAVFQSCNDVEKVLYKYTNFHERTTSWARIRQKKTYYAFTPAISIRP